MPNEKMQVTFIQNKTGAVIAVRIAGAEFPVVNASPVPGVGRLDAVVTIGDIDPKFVVDDKEKG